MYLLKLHKLYSWMVFGWLFFTFSVIPIIKPLKGYWLDEFYDLKLRIAQRNQARFTKNFFRIGPGSISGSLAC